MNEQVSILGIRALVTSLYATKVRLQRAAQVCRALRLV